MPVLPDPDALLAVADRITRHAAALRVHAQRTSASVAGTAWRGTAARSFAVEALGVCAALRSSADRLDGAAAALRRHAAAVRDLLATAVRIGIETARAGQAVLEVTGDALTTAGDTLGGLASDTLGALGL